MSEHPREQLVDSFAFNEPAEGNFGVDDEWQKATDESMWHLGTSLQEHFRRFPSTESPLLAGLWAGHNLPLSLLIQRPFNIVKAVETATILHKAREITDLGDMRVIGAGNIVSEALGFCELDFTDAPDNLIQLIAKSFEPPAVYIASSRMITRHESGTETSLNGAYLQGNFDMVNQMTQWRPLTNGRVHFSDPIWGRVDRESEDATILNDSTFLQQALFSNKPSERLLFNRTLADLEEVPSAGGFFTADSAADLKESGEKVDTVALFRFEPEIITKGLSDRKGLEFSTELLSSFSDLIVDQIREDGLLIITFGKGNSYQGYYQRRLMHFLLKKLARRTKCEHRFFEDKDAEKLPVTGTKHSVEEFSMENILLGTAITHSGLVIRVSQEFREALNREDLISKIHGSAVDSARKCPEWRYIQGAPRWRKFDEIMDELGKQDEEFNKCYPL